MAERLGTVVYWVANVIAVAVLFLGAFMGYSEYLRGADAYYGAPLWVGFFGLETWLTGRVFLYALAGR